MADELVLRVGELGGRITAMESRMDRHENYMGEKLRSVGNQLDAMDTKLDQIAIAAAEGRAEAAGQRRIVRIGITVLGVLTAIAGTMASLHIGIHP